MRFYCRFMSRCEKDAMFINVVKSPVIRISTAKRIMTLKL